MNNVELKKDLAALAATLSALLITFSTVGNFQRHWEGESDCVGTNRKSRIRVRYSEDEEPTLLLIKDPRDQHGPKSRDRRRPRELLGTLRESAPKWVLYAAVW